MAKRKILKSFPAKFPFTEHEALAYADGARDCLAEALPDTESFVHVFKSFSGERGSEHNVELILRDDTDETPPRPVNEVAVDLLKQWSPGDNDPMGYDFFKYMEELNKSAEYYSGETK